MPHAGTYHLPSAARCPLPAAHSLGHRSGRLTLRAGRLARAVRCRCCSMMSDYKVDLVNDGMQEMFIVFAGPKDSPYEGGTWKVHVELPEAYPYKSPSIGFMNKIFHPNVDETAGSVCLDVINQTWSPMFDLINVFDVFLPQLLLYPNPTDPLNGEAAALLMRDPTGYQQRVKEYVQKYASGGAAALEQLGGGRGNLFGDSSDDEDLEMSDEDEAADADLD